MAAIGITNQRETVVVWERASGRPIHRAIVWQDRRTAPVCAALKVDGHEPNVAARTGLLLDPYFSATKIAWLLDAVPGARARAERGELAAGTIDSWLLWRLTGGAVHATDASNASRTLIYDISGGRWDAGLAALFRVPLALLPEVRDSAGDFGSTDPALFGRAIPIKGVAGDQQAATIGQACVRPGMMKSTYGTGCFALLVTGETPVPSSNRLLTTVAWQIAGRRTYALEGSIFIAGAAVQWLRDGLGVIAHSAETGRLAAEADPTQDVILVPAFTGLGAPWWDADARGALFGLTRGTGPRELARAALEAVAFQTADLLDAMHRDIGAAASGPCSGSTAAWPLRTGPCSGSPTSSTPPSTGRCDRDHRTRRGRARRHRLRPHPRSRGPRRALGARAPLRTRHGRRRARAQTRALGRRRLPHADQGLIHVRPRPPRRRSGPHRRPRRRRARTFVSTDAAKARVMAEAADARAKAGLSLGPLDGRIVSIKDCCDVIGEPTRAGSATMTGVAPARADAPAVARLRRAGAVLIGRTNMSEFAFTGSA